MQNPKINRNPDLENFSNSVFWINTDVTKRFDLDEYKNIQFASEGDIKDFIWKFINRTIEENLKLHYHSIPKIKIWLKTPSQNLSKKNSSRLLSPSPRPDNKIFQICQKFLKDAVPEWLNDYSKSGMIPDLQKHYAYMQNYSPQILTQTYVILSNVKSKVICEFLRKTLQRLETKFKM